jgi:nucleoside-diphosphate-sugar epimerase
VRVTLIGAEGFVGSGFARNLPQRGVELIAVSRSTYALHAGSPSDVVIEAACNSKKFLAENQPFDEFDLSVTHRLRTLRDFPAPLHVHISSVDVYSDLSSPATTREASASAAGPENPSHYGFHKLLAEQLVRHHAKTWLIIRLAGMVGPGLRKNPVYDILHGQPLRIHPDSQYQFMHTDNVAECVWTLVEHGITNEIFNVCGAGLISPREISRMIGTTLDLSQLGPDAKPRIVDVGTSKIEAIVPMPATHSAVAGFIKAESPGAGKPPLRL